MQTKFHGVYQEEHTLVIERKLGKKRSEIFRKIPNFPSVQRRLTQIRFEWCSAMFHLIISTIFINASIIQWYSEHNLSSSLVFVLFCSLCGCCMKSHVHWILCSISLFCCFFVHFTHCYHQCTLLFPPFSILFMSEKWERERVGEWCDGRATCHSCSFQLVLLCACVEIDQHSLSSPHTHTHTTYYVWTFPNYSSI